MNVRIRTHVLADICRQFRAEMFKLKADCLAGYLIGQVTEAKDGVEVRVDGVVIPEQETGKRHCQGTAAGGATAMEQIWRKAKRSLGTRTIWARFP